MRDAPELYFRMRDTNAAVFRVDHDERHGRIVLTQIAVATPGNGRIKPHGEHELSAAEETGINDWIAARRDGLARRARDDAERTAEAIGRTAQWVQSSATPEDLDAVAHRLLMAMHDLRTTLVRRQGERRRDQG